MHHLNNDTLHDLTCHILQVYFQQELILQYSLNTIRADHKTAR